MKTNQKTYVVTLAASVLADLTIAVRADSEGDAARLALEGADYDMQHWCSQPGRDSFMDLRAVSVDLATGDNVECADQQHLL